MTSTGVTRRCSIDVSWGDCDPAGIVFYPRYFAWFDHGAHRLLESVGLHHRALTERWGVVGLSLVDAQASFRRPATYGSRLVVDSRVAAIGRSSLTVEHVISEGGDVVASGREVRVWVARAGDDPRALRAAPIPAEVVRALQTGMPTD